MSRRYVVGIFEKEEAAVEAVRRLRRDGWAIADAHSPYPVPAMSDALGLKHSRLGWVTAAGAFAGGSGILGLALYINLISWPINIGGKPHASLPAFFPPVFEISVLGGALATVGALLFVSRLFPTQEAEVEIPGVNDDRFAVVLDAEQSAGAGERIAETLRACGAEVRQMSGREGA